ncbi:hypothetical protein ACTXG7_03790 [Mycolicibacterium sp. Dal123E01]|uniref:hypothetical protein n=1 Tax=Mycolicibacterium sp. Dal123E01 TaxID=3457578 RepID=UPI00403ED830
MRSLTFGAAAAATAVLAGCTPTPTPSQPTVISPAPSTTSQTSAPASSSVIPSEHGSLAQCLHQHGVPDSAGSAVLGPPTGVDPGVWDQAKKACSQLEPGPAN